MADTPLTARAGPRAAGGIAEDCSTQASSLACKRTEVSVYAQADNAMHARSISLKSNQANGPRAASEILAARKKGVRNLLKDSRPL